MILKRLVASRGFWISVVIIILFSIWLGPSTYRKWKADKMVDELCAKDGGIKVYATVELPATMFNEYGQPKIKFADKAGAAQNELDTGLYFSFEEQDIVGNHNSSAISELAVWQSKVRLQRKSDGKVLGETTRYSRSGGDAIGPWHPSSYNCPVNAGVWDLAKRVVINKSVAIGGKQ